MQLMTLINPQNLPKKAPKLEMPKQPLLMPSSSKTLSNNTKPSKQAKAEQSAAKSSRVFRYSFELHSNLGFCKGLGLFVRQSEKAKREASG
ncbi:hypothetical protein [Neisseria weixii]|uniref:hypothetical protein n=1 Tax=Neisseria weixii TaxID=1853276 RepID=UPI0035A09251